MTETMIDIAHAAMAEAPDDDAVRLKFYDAFADAELFLLIEDEAGARITPRLFALEEGRFVLAFDEEERLTRFNEGPAPYAALPGRVIAQQLAGSGIGLGLNLAVAPSAFLMPPEAMDWLAGTLNHDPEATEAKPQSFSVPADLPKALLDGLVTKLSRAPGLASAALLSAVSYADGRRGHLLALLDARPGAEPALARAASEALTFSGIDAGEIDVVFLSSGEPAAQRMAGAALRFDLPAALEPKALAPAAPGMDPDKPPKLR